MEGGPAAQGLVGAMLLGEMINMAPRAAERAAAEAGKLNQKLADAMLTCRKRRVQ